MNQNKVMIKIKKGERFTLDQFLEKSKLAKFISEEDTAKERKKIRRMAENVINFYRMCNLIKKVDTKLTLTKRKLKGGGNQDRRGRPKNVYEAKKDLSFYLGEYDENLDFNG